MYVYSTFLGRLMKYCRVKQNNKEKTAKKEIAKKKTFEKGWFGASF